MSQSKEGEGGIYNVTNLNLYHYAGNNPIKYIDPDGKSATNEVMGVGGAVVTGVEISYATFTLAEIFEKYGVVGGGIMLLLLLLQGDTQPSIEINSVEVPQQFGETQAEDTKKRLEENSESPTDDSKPKDNEHLEGKQNSNKGKTIEPPGEYPGNDPTKAPEGYEWHGKPGSQPVDTDGGYFNPKTGESLRPDLNHPKGINPHWDYKAPDGSLWRWFPGGGE
jgi:hypothetical protein